MSSEPAIEVRSIGKRYAIYGRPHDRLLQALVPRIGRMASPFIGGRHAAKLSDRRFFQEFWALSDISFTVARGETVGIIGRNGAGKSTLLQLIAGTLTPTTGSISVKGRVAALLELGSGFNPEFTGLENVYLNGMLLGLTKRELDERLDAILDFADIGDFVAQPVKTYSSGMVVRLAFAVQSQVDPEILIVDEALSVGDFAFTLKCMKRLDELRERGCSILFTSHDVGMVQKLCSRVLFLEGGRQRGFSDPATICSDYITSLTPKSVTALPEVGDQAGAELAHWVPQAEMERFEQNFRGHRSGTGEVRIVFVKTASRRGTGIAAFDEEVTVEIVIEAFEAVSSPCVSFYVIDKSGQLLLGSNTKYEHAELPDLRGGDFVRVEFKFVNRLREDEYGITVIASSFISPVNNHYLDYLEPATTLRTFSPPDVTRWAIHSPDIGVTCDWIRPDAADASRFANAA